MVVVADHLPEQTPRIGEKTARGLRLDAGPDFFKGPSSVSGRSGANDFASASYQLGSLQSGTDPRSAYIDSRNFAAIDATTDSSSSSSIQNPISFAGRVLDVVMEIYAITVIGSMAGALGAFLVKRGEELDAAAKSA